MNVTLRVQYTFHANVTHVCALPVIQSSCKHGEARLADGNTKREGRVEVCIDGVWSAVCGKDWDDREARTLCRQLKFPNHGESYMQTHSQYFLNHALPTDFIICLLSIKISNRECDVLSF